MADEQLSWVIKVVDKASTPLRRVESSMEQLDQALGHLKSGKLASAITSFRQLARSTEDGGAEAIAARVGMKGLAGAASLAASATVAVGAAMATAGGFAAYGAGKFTALAVETSAWAQATKLGLDMVSGEAGAGQSAFATLTDEAQRLGVSVRETITAYQGLRVAGFDAGEALTWTRLTADMQAAGATAEGVALAMTQIGQIAGKGTVELEDLKSIAENAKLPLAAMYEGMAKVSGKSVADLRKMQQGGKLTKDIVLPGIQAAILSTVGQTQAGAAAEKAASTTLRGSFGRGKASGEAWLMSVAERITPILDQLATVFGAVVQRIASDGTFQRLADVVVQTYEVIGEVLSSMSGLVEGGLRTAVQWVIDGLAQFQSAVLWMRENWDGLALGFAMLSKVLAPIVFVLETTAGALIKFYEALTWVAQKLASIGLIDAPDEQAAAPTVPVGSVSRDQVMPAPTVNQNTGGINVTVNAQTGASAQDIGKETASAIAGIQARIAQQSALAY